jgi:7-cyano-7-deazaguanine reductase
MNPKDDTSTLKELGRGAPSYKDLKESAGPRFNDLETFPNQFPDRDYSIRIEFPEFTSLCPMTGQPDFGTIIIEYIPDKICVESKSLKIYLFKYRNHGSFMETITNTIRDHLVNLMGPRSLKVIGEFAPRGATQLTITAEYEKGKITGPMTM